MCEEYGTCQTRTERPVLAGHSDPLFVPKSVMKTRTPSTDDFAQEDLLQKHQGTSGQIITTKSCD